MIFCNPAGEAKRMKILIVEDDKDISRELKELLENSVFSAIISIPQLVLSRSSFALSVRMDVM